MFSRISLPHLCLIAVFSFTLVPAPSFSLTSGQIAQTTPEQLRRVEPPNPSATVPELERRGDELRFYKFYADAGDYYLAAIAKHDSAVLRNKLGIAELNMMRYRDSKKAFERAIKLDNHYAEAFNNLGVIYYADDHNNRKAIRNYEKAIKLNDQMASFYSNLGTALFASRKYEKAAKEYQRAMEIDPTIFEHHSRFGTTANLTPADRGQFAFTIAKLYLHSGDIQHCLLYLRKAQEEGIKVSQKLASDPAFHSYQNDPRFVAVIRHEAIAEAPDPRQPDPH